MRNDFKLLFLVSSLVASTALFAQSAPPSQPPAGKAPAKSTQVAQGQPAPGGQAAGASL